MALRNTGTTLTFHNDARILRRCTELHESFVAKMKQSFDPTKFKSMMLFQPIPSYFGEISKQRGGNMLGLDNVHHNAVMWTAGVEVELDEAALAKAQAEMSKFTAQVKEYSKSVNGDLDFLFLNYADASQDPLGSYGSTNIKHIRTTAAKYDPTGVFQRRIPGGFKISRVG
jgi:hypothetical protein